MLDITIRILVAILVAGTLIFLDSLNLSAYGLNVGLGLVVALYLAHLQVSLLRRVGITVMYL